MPATNHKSGSNALGTALLGAAVRINSTALLKAAIVLNADRHARDRFGNTFLHKAHSIEMALALCQLGLDVNALNYRFETPLACALQGLVQKKDKAARLVHYLLQHDANPSLGTESNNPLHFTIRHHTWIDNEIIELVIKRSSDLGIKNKDGLTPLACALRMRAVYPAILLLKHGAINSDADQNNLSIFRQVDNNYTHLREDPNYPDLLAEMFKRHLNHMCINTNMTDFSQKVLSPKAKPLHYAAFFCIAKGLAPYLGPSSKEISEPGYKGRTPLHLAVLNGNVSAVRALLNANADFTVCDDYGLPPLYYAAQTSHHTYKTMQLLIAAGANVNQKLCATHDNVTLLHAAARQPNSASSIAALIKFGADVNAKDGFFVKKNSSIINDHVSLDPFINNSARTPLHYAVADPNNVAALLRAGATIQADSLGFTPEIYANQMQCQESASILQSVSKVTTWTNSLQISMQKALNVAASLASNASNVTIFPSGPKKNMA